MVIRTFKGKTPVIGEGTFVAETAAVIGDVRIGRQSSIWYGAVVRGDENSIDIGDRVSIQDCAVVHISHGETGKVHVGNDVIVGHNATVHACTVGDHCLIGMGSTVLDGAEIGEGSIIAAQSLVLGRTKVGPYEMWAGVPAKFVKKISPELVAKMIDRGVQLYVELADIYSSEGQTLIP